MPYLFLDLETTGLDPARDGLMEVAWFVAERGTFRRLSETKSIAIYPEAPALVRLRENDYVREMHTRTGLIARSFGGVTAHEAQHEILQSGVVKRSDDPWELAGNSVHFDLLFLSVHMPQLAAQLSHRVFNVSTLIEWYGDPEIENPQQHSAAHDIEWSYAATLAFLGKRDSK